MTNNSTRTTNADAATIQSELRRARIIVYGTILFVPERILAVTARHLRRKRTRTLSPVTCMDQTASIPTSSARAIQKTQKRRANRVTTLRNVEMTCTTVTIAATAAGTIPQQVSAIHPFRAKGKSTTSRATTRSPTRITILITLQKKRRLVKKNGVGHKSPTQKKRKTLVEPDSGMKKIPNKHRTSKSDGDLHNLYDTDDVMNDDAKSCLSINDDNGLSFAAFDDAFGFPN